MEVDRDNASAKSKKGYWNQTETALKKKQKVLLSKKDSGWKRMGQRESNLFTSSSGKAQKGSSQSKSTIGGSGTKAEGTNTSSKGTFQNEAKEAVQNKKKATYEDDFHRRVAEQDVEFDDEDNAEYFQVPKKKKKDLFSFY